MTTPDALNNHLAYVRKHDLHATVAGMVTHLSDTRPDDPKRAMIEYLQGLLPKKAPASFSQQHSLPQGSSGNLLHSTATDRPPPKKVGSFRRGSNKNIEMELGVSVRLAVSPEDEGVMLTKRAPSFNRLKSSLSVQEREVDTVTEPKRKNKPEGGNQYGTPRSEENAPAFELGTGGACQCTGDALVKNAHQSLFNEVDKLDFHTLFHACATCLRRPSQLLSCHSMKSYCQQHAAEVYTSDPENEKLFINYELMWYEKAYFCYECQEFSQDETEAFDEALNQLCDSKGTYMKEPVTDCDVVELNSNVACVSMQGWRSSQEDAEVICRIDGVYICAVFDGHGGTIASKWMSQNIVACLTDEVSDISTCSIEALKEGITKAFYAADDLLQEASEDCGCVGTTCCLVIVRPDDVLCANVGDSRAVMLRENNEVVELSVDQTLDSETETTRITSAGYSIKANRIEGTLSVPRAFGDFDFKQCGGKGPNEQAVSTEPEFVHIPRDGKEDLILIGCDGIWDGYESEQALTFVQKKLAENSKENQPNVAALKGLLLNNVAAALDDEAIGTDNQTCILVVLNDHSVADDVVESVTESPRKGGDVSSQKGDDIKAEVSVDGTHIATEPSAGVEETAPVEDVTQAASEVGAAEVPEAETEAEKNTADTPKEEEETRKVEEVKEENAPEAQKEPEEKVEAEAEQKVEEKVEEKVETTEVPKVEEKVEAEVPKVEEKVEAEAEQKVEEKVETEAEVPKAEEKAEAEAEQKVEEKVEAEAEVPKAEEKAEAEAEQTVEEKVEAEAKEEKAEEAKPEEPAAEEPAATPA